MRRKRARQHREPEFGLDSFLDVITNVIGILVRMMLVVWAGAQAYHAAHYALELKPPPEAKVNSRRKIDLARWHEAVAFRKKLVETDRTRLGELREELSTITAQRQRAETDRQALASRLAETDRELALLEQESQRLVAGVASRQDRIRAFEKAIAGLQVAPRSPKVVVDRHFLRYRAPVSRPVNATQYFFECSRGRVSFVDMDAFVARIREDVALSPDKLARTGKLEGVTNRRGDFRVRYALKAGRNKTVLGTGDLDYRLIVEPVVERRGESLARALRPDSKFRQIVDFADPRTAVLVFWVYPDSFATFRRLREYAYERGLEVAANPLPFGVSIILSPTGTRSLSQ